MDFTEFKEYLHSEMNQLQKDFPDYSFSIGKEGGYGITWGSIFVVDPEGITIGCLKFNDESGKFKFSHTKVYGINNPYIKVFDSFWAEFTQYMEDDPFEDSCYVQEAS